jgi:hypothetical protein
MPCMHDWRKCKSGAVCWKCSEHWSFEHLCYCVTVYGPEWACPVEIPTEAWTAFRASQERATQQRHRAAIIELERRAEERAAIVKLQLEGKLRVASELERLAAEAVQRRAAIMAAQRRATIIVPPVPVLQLAPPRALPKPKLKPKPKPKPEPKPDGVPVVLDLGGWPTTTRVDIYTMMVENTFQRNLMDLASTYANHLMRERFAWDDSSEICDPIPTWGRKVHPKHNGHQ